MLTVGRAFAAVTGQCAPRGAIRANGCRIAAYPPDAAVAGKGAKGGLGVWPTGLLVVALAVLAVTANPAAAQLWTDHPVVVGETPVKALHFAELREAVNALRSRCGLDRMAWTDPVLTPGATPVKAGHVIEIREGLRAAYAACGDSAPVFGAVSARAPIEAAHVTELRDAIDNIQMRPVDIDDLVENPRVAAALRWRDTENRLLAYPEWPPALKDKLAWFAERLLTGRSGLPDVPINRADATWWTILSESDAEDLYAANVAYSLVLEARGALPWSLYDLSDRELGLLLGSENFYDWYGGFDVDGRRVDGYAVVGPVVPAPPGAIRDFLTAEGLIADSRRETLIRIIDWARYHLYHYYWPADPEGYEPDVDHWGYRGGAPLARILEGTTRKEDGFEGHATAGCHGTNWFLIHVLRAVNIPAEYIIWAGHAVPSFPSEALSLSHGDDPYNQLAKPLPPPLPELYEPFPASAIPIDEATYRERFKRTNSEEENERSIDTQVVMLAVEHLSPVLLLWRCYDLYHGLSKEEGELYRPGNTGVGRQFTIAELDAMRFWERLDERVAQFGGCWIFEGFLGPDPR